MLSGFHGGQRLPAVLPGHGMTDACVACRIMIAVLAALPFSFPLIFREKKELMGKERNLDDGCDGRGHGVRAAFRWRGPGRGAWPAWLQAAWLREPGSGVRAWPDPGVLQ